MITSNGTAPSAERVRLKPLPLVLDVDDALLRTDLLHETAIAYLKGNPLRVFELALWTFQGKAVLKRKLSERVALVTEDLPVDERLVELARAAKAEGREVGIATAADELLALRLSRRFDFIDFVVASDGTVNMKGATKAAALKKRFHEGFAYAGDSRSDLKVWSEAESIVLAGAAAKTARKAKALGKPIEAEFERPGLSLKGWAKALRVHQWAKNALVFVPLVLSGMAADPMADLKALIAFAAMSLMASGTYLVNDLFDLAHDRAHWSKCHRPIASGLLRIKHAVPLAFGLVVASLGLGLTLGPVTLGLIAVYMATTLGYSLYIKRQPIVDAFTLAVLFTLRLGVGIAAVSAVPSPWLLVFSMFLFTSLSFAKRQTEIQRSLAKGRTEVSGRGYQTTDGAMVTAMGVATAMAAITIFTLYIMNDVYSADFYNMPVMLWVFPAALFMWVSRIWLLCARGQLNDDPVAFAIKDKVSLALGGLMGAAFLVGWLL